MVTLKLDDLRRSDRRYTRVDGLSKCEARGYKDIVDEARGETEKFICISSNKIPVPSCN